MRCGSPISPPPLPAGATSIVEDVDDETASPWRSIWLRPRATIRRIVRRDAGGKVLLLASLAGIGEVLDRASFRDMGDRISLGPILLIALLLGPLAGMASVFFGAFMLRHTGGWLGGRATSEDLRAALAWGSVPLVVVGLPVWALELALFGQEMFTEATPRLEKSLPLLLALLVLLGIEMVAAGWSLVLSLKCIGEVHGFSAWRALGAGALAGAIVIVPIVIVVLIVVGVSMALR